jgi:hypothetical protein
MGFMETAVVVYLRKIYYAGGFNFPLIPVSPDIALTEFLREAATIIMLIGIGVLAGKNAVQRFAFFLFCFAIWDIFYYVFLKMLLHWPDSLFTWDILFLIPVPWVGPVLAPCIISISMIIFAFVLFYLQETGKYVRISFMEWMLFISGSLVVILSFVWDYITYLSGSSENKVVWTLSGNSDLFEEVKNYVPNDFNWWIFAAGQVIICLAIFFVYKRIRSS